MSKTIIRLKLTETELKLLIASLTDSLDVAYSHDFTNDIIDYQRLLKLVKEQSQ